MSNTIKLSEIKIAPRMRADLGDLSGLKESICKHGLIQPIVLDPQNNLVAGERRFRAHQQLGMDTIRFVYIQETPEDVRAEIEFEENYWRKNFSWQEEALGILNIYRKKKRQGALEGFKENWHKLIAEMFGMSVGSVNYTLVVASKLEKELSMPPEKRRYHNFQSVAEGWRLGVLAEKEDEANRILTELAKRNASNRTEQALAQKQLVEVKRIEQAPDLLAFERERYQANPNNTIPFEQWWGEHKAHIEESANTVNLSGSVIHGDCIDYMNLPDNAGVFDHIITDPPYAIDMDMLNQQNVHSGLKDLDRVVDAHQVDENKSLLARFFPAAFKCTKDKAFVITCCDIMMWQYMYDLAIAAGFAVQRWPYNWRKINQAVMNNCAMYNTTKDYEPVMICRKPGSTLMNKRNTSFTDAGNTEAVKLTGHPFAKPFELTRDLCQMASLEGQLILEPFAGGGSMAIQMLRMKRRVIAVEKEAHHYNSLLENIKQQVYLKLNPNFKFS